MPLDPHEMHPCPALLPAPRLGRLVRLVAVVADAIHVADLLPLLNVLQDLLDEVLVLDRLLRGVEPAVSAPFLEPGRYAVYRVFGVGEDGDGPVAGGELQCS